MAATDPLTALYLALDESPNDLVTTQALADLYEEQSNTVAASCLRWTIQRNRRPFRYLRSMRETGPVRVSSDAWHDGWYWWVLEDVAHAREWGYPRECCLPQAIWERLKHSFVYDPAVFKQFPSRRAAYEALFAVWLTVPRQSRE